MTRKWQHPYYTVVVLVHCVACTTELQYDQWCSAICRPNQLCFNRLQAKQMWFSMIYEPNILYFTICYIGVPSNSPTDMEGSTIEGDQSIPLLHLCIEFNSILSVHLPKDLNLSFKISASHLKPIPTFTPVASIFHQGLNSSQI